MPEDESDGIAAAAGDSVIEGDLLVPDPGPSKTEVTPPTESDVSASKVRDGPDPEPVLDPALSAVEAPPPPPTGPPGTVRLGADHPFEVTVDGTVYTKLEARQGISLRPGRYTARFSCLKCPAGVVPDQSVTIDVVSGQKSSKVVQFPVEVP